MKCLAILFALAISPAFAEQQTLEQRIGAQIGACTIQNAALVLQVEQLQAKVKELDDAAKKVEPPK